MWIPYGEINNMKRILLLISVCLMLQGCACFYIKTPELTAWYCRGGDQSIEYKEFSQESEGEVPSGFFGMVLDLISK